MVLSMKLYMNDEYFQFVIVNFESKLGLMFILKCKKEELKKMMFSMPKVSILVKS